MFLIKLSTKVNKATFNQNNDRFIYTLFISSPEQNAQWELLGHRDVRRPSSSVVRRRRPSSVVNNFFKQHLLLNYLVNLNQTSQEWSLGGPLPK